MTSKERTELARLQKEYNELHERLGYSRDDGTCRAINNRLGAILQEAMIRNFLFLFINILLQFDRRCGMIYSVLLCTAYREVPQWRYLITDYGNF